MKILLPILYVIGLYGAYIAGFLYCRNQSMTFRFPRLTVLLILMIAVPSTLQFIFPPLLTTLQRDPVRFLHGEWRRLVTPLFVQDGGIAGAIFNLIRLLFVGTIAEQLWRRREMFLLFFLGGIPGHARYEPSPITAGVIDATSSCIFRKSVL